MIGPTIASTSALGSDRVLALEPHGRAAELLVQLIRDVWYACEELEIPLLPLYARGYTSIGCEPCTSLPLDANDLRSGRWAGRKVECGIHVQAIEPAPAH